MMDNIKTQFQKEGREKPNLQGERKVYENSSPNISKMKEKK
jgi:hypothetical protein